MSDLRIPDWKPLDFSGIAEIPQIYLAAQKAKMDSETQRQYAENAKQKLEFERESAQRAREDAAHQRDVERTKALPALFRAARNSVSMANLMAQPYGVSFEEQPGQAPRVSGDLFQAANNANGNFARQALATPEQTDIAPKPPTIDAVSGGQAPAPGDEAEAVHGPVEEATETLAAAKPRIMARYNGQAFELPDEAQGTGLAAKYQSVFDHAVAQGIPEEKAFQVALTMQEKDDAQKAIADRVQAQIGARGDLKDKFGLTAAEQLAEKEKQRAQSQTNAEILARSRVAAAAPGLKQEAANDRAMSLLERRGAAIKNTAQFAKLAANDKTLRGLSENLASTETLPHKDAMIQVARIFRQAQPTEGEMHLLYNSLGGWADKPEQFVQKVMNGDLSPEQLRQLQASAKIVLKEHEEDKRRFRQVAGKALGPGSGFEGLPDQAQAMYDSLAAELGLENEPPLSAMQGGITVGSGKRPSTQPRAGNMVTIRNKKTGESKTVTREQAKAMGAIP